MSYSINGVSFEVSEPQRPTLTYVAHVDQGAELGIWWKELSRGYRNMRARKAQRLYYETHYEQELERRARARAGQLPTRDKDGKREYARARYVQAKIELRALVVTEKIKRGECAHCGLKVDPVTHDHINGLSAPHYAFDFDHRDPATKAFGVSALATQQSSGVPGAGTIYSPRRPALLMAEMAKCDLLCAICHRIKTAAGGWL